MAAAFNYTAWTGGGREASKLESFFNTQSQWRTNVCGHTIKSTPTFYGNLIPIRKRKIQFTHEITFQCIFISYKIVTFLPENLKLSGQFFYTLKTGEIAEDFHF